MTRHIMVDLETLGVTPNCVILTLGAVEFDPFSDRLGRDLYVRLDVDQQDAMGRFTDPNTLEWWSKQDPAVIEEAFSEDNRISVQEGMERFHKFVWGCDAVWSHGSIFDIAIIQDLYQQINRPLSWNYWQIKDTRTIFDLGVDPNMPQGNKHNALEDAKRQAIGVQNCYRVLYKK